jgi:hypothetical protein
MRCLYSDIFGQAQAPHVEKIRRPALFEFDTNNIGTMRVLEVGDRLAVIPFMTRIRVHVWAKDDYTLRYLP